MREVGADLAVGAAVGVAGMGAVVDWVVGVVGGWVGEGREVGTCQQ